MDTNGCSRAIALIQKADTVSAPGERPRLESQHRRAALPGPATEEGECTMLRTHGGEGGSGGDGTGDGSGKQGGQ